ncbi:hypothetical protein Acid345_1071 [Candidatus Koribacter versatilis Ellin345]|uniref:DUF2059 domain-containing protein n=1 Tax=Koribacter versatilis (strain Ellin345) TaxID=204669 RepID=Q1ISS6_KORVE|nr:DUF2059 domain-containing protein [Candidatus Koribacter versatilis]ABF40074.1 hypothetical protein Acid345_1071 [Candidatus Koribacter versatilis Ellin345]
MKPLFAACCLLVSSLFGYAQQAPVSSANSPTAVPAEERATKEDVLALMDVMHARRNAQAGMDMMTDVIKKQERAHFLEKHPDASPAALKKLDAQFDGIIKPELLDEMISDMVPIYQKYLSHEDAISILSFYSSPSGQRFLERMPLLLHEVGEMSTALITRHKDEIHAESEKRVKEFQQYLKAHPAELGDPVGKESEK